MEIQKKAIKAGNSSAVILPRAWLNKEVRVELIRKNPDDILNDVLEILKKDISLGAVIGIYLAGSYARGEENENSDIDVLVITDNIDKGVMHEGVYNILIVSYQLLYQKLERDLFPVGQMLKEAKPLLNSDYIKNVDIKVTKKNVKWYIDTTEDKLEAIKEHIDEAIKNNKKYLRDRVAYTIILRIRTLEIIKKLAKNKDYSKKELISRIKKISGGKDAYEGYLAVKNNLKEKERITIDETKRLYDYLKKDLALVKRMI